MTLNKLVNGKRIELTQEEKQSFNDAQPNNDELLNKTKVTRCLYIEEKRKEYQYSNIIFEGNSYEASFMAQSKFLTFLLMNPTGDINWRLADGETWITLDQNQANSLKEAIILREVTAYQHESIKSREIKSITTNPADVNNINWEL